MSTATRIPLAEATRLAEQIYADLAPYCDRLEITGSIRRQVATVGDIELVATSHLAAQVDLFGEPSGVQSDLLEDRVAWLLEHGELAPRLTADGQARQGPRYKALTCQGTAVDLFICRPPAQWGVILAIRTGPAAFSKALVTTKREGGYLPDHLQVQSGALRYRTSGEVIPTAEERDLFAAIGLPWIAPEDRR